MDGLIATAVIRVLIVLAVVALTSPIWVPFVILMRRVNVEAVVAIAIFLAWTFLLATTFGLENLRVLLGWTIGPGSR